MSVLALLRFELRVAFAMMRRYPAQSVVTFALMYVLFMGLFTASRGMAGDPLVPGAEPATRALAGFLLWYLSVFALDAMSQSVADEAQAGTLEQLCMAHHPLPLVLSVRTLARVFASLALALPLFGFLAFSIGVPLALPSARALCATGLTICGLLGFGYVLAALAVLFKRIGNATTLVHFCLLFVALSPIERFSPGTQALAAALPLAPGVKILRAPVGVAVADVEWAVLLLNSIGYLSAGVLTLRWAERRARAAGLLGHY